MKALARIVAMSALSVVALALLLYVRVADVFQVRRFVSVLAPPALESQRTTGEWVAGTRMDQVFYFNPSDEFLHTISAADPARIALQLATYGKRTNAGRCTVTLVAGDLTSKAVIDYATVQDNAFHALLFPDIRLLDLVGLTNRLQLVVDEGRPGSSITAWLTTDRRNGGVSVNDAPRNISLVFSLGILRDDYVRLAKVVGLLVICGFATGVLISCNFRRP